MAWSAAEMPGPVSRTDSSNEPLLGAGLDHHLAGVRELDGVADEVEQDLRQPALVPTAGGRSGCTSALNASFLSSASGSTAL